MPDHLGVPIGSGGQLDGGVRGLAENARLPGWRRAGRLQLLSRAAQGAGTLAARKIVVKYIFRRRHWGVSLDFALWQF